MNELLLAKNYKELSVYECGDEECVKTKAIVLSKKNYHLFHYVVSGKGILILNKKEYHLGKGAIFSFLVKPMRSISQTRKIHGIIVGLASMEKKWMNIFLA